MSETKKKPNTIKSIGKKVANNGNASDYEYVPIGADSDNVDRPDGSTVEESLTQIESGKVEIVPVEILPETDIKVYPYIYALIKPTEKKGVFYEYKNGEWIPYCNGSKGIWIGTKEECAKDFDNIENGTIVIIVKKVEESGDTHTHNYVEYVTKAPTYSEPGIKTCTCFLCGDSHTEEIPALVDSVSPAGVIRIGTNEYATWKDTISFDTYYKDNQNATIEATDNETGVKEIAYYLANTAISNSNIGTVTWTPYTDPFTLEPNNNYIVYARITDNADNVTYICSDGIVMDNIPPVFEGLEDGGTYPTGTVLTVEEGATLTVNGQPVTLTDNSYTFTEVMDNSLLSLTDRAGNVNNIIINVEESKNREFSITKNNYTMAGIKENSLSSFGNLIIPETFVYDGINYTITSIGDEGFKNCRIGSVYIPSTVKSIGKDAFYSCELLSDITLSEGLINIGESAFHSCDRITQINLPNTVKSIEKCAFMFSGLSSIDFPENINFIGEQAFSYCENLKSINFSTSENLLTIKYNAFCNCSVTTVTIPSNIDMNNIGISIFELCKDLTSVIFESGVTSIPSAMFSECSNLTSVQIPETISNIKYAAFRYCTKLIVTIPDNVINIEEDAFENVPHIYYNGSASGAPWGAKAIN